MDILESQSAAEYLRHAYEVPDAFPQCPLPDEHFAGKWQEAKGREALDFLADGFGLPVSGFVWRRKNDLQISFAHTLGGRLPVISAGCHEDFRSMEALLNGREKSRELPLTVNAFAMQARAEHVFRHRLLLLNSAPYSNVPARRLGLSDEDWLERSRRLRLRHECAHYETLRLLSGMKNHAHDEILADALGQIAAFGKFDADRQRLFFGLERGTNKCNGRLSFYCQKLPPQEREEVYRAVDMVLDSIENRLDALLAQNAEELRIFAALAGTSIAERLETAEGGGGAGPER